MREIKFRALVGGQWFYGDILNWAGEAQIWADGHNFIVKNKETIGQYTGLKDKNGVEIHEGDIVKYVTNYYGKRQERQKVVEWIDDMQDDSFGEPLSMGYRFHGDELEVIGNIYENPELLNNIERRTKVQKQF